MRLCILESVVEACVIETAKVAAVPERKNLRLHRIRVKTLGNHLRCHFVRALQQYGWNLLFLQWHSRRHHMEQHDKTFYQIYNTVLMLLGGLLVLAFGAGFYLSPEERELEQAQDVLTFASGRALWGLLAAVVLTLVIYALNRTLNQLFSWRMPVEQINRRAAWQMAVLAGTVLVYTALFVIAPKMLLG